MDKEKFTISESDLVRIFASKERKNRKMMLFLLFAENFGYFLVILVVVFAAINFNSISAKVKYWYSYDFKATSSNIVAPDLAIVATGTTPKTSSSGQVIYTNSEVAALKMQENQITIPALGVVAPITWKVPNTETATLAALKNGAIQIGGTALPGENGNIYLTGHSSNYIWIKSNYNSIFATLNRLVVGDFIYVKYAAQVYQYKVAKQEVVTADDTSIMSSDGTAKLTLVTCWPVGTSYKRYVVVANQVFPNPVHNKNVTSSAQFDNLPAGI